MKTEIKHRYDKSVLFEGEFVSLKLALEFAVKSKINLNYADMQGADMRGADMRGADIDFSCWPLWCGGLQCKIDERIARQLVYHALSVSLQFVPGLTPELIEWANKFHRCAETRECPPLELPVEKCETPE